MDTTSSTPADTAAALDITEEALGELLEQARQRLLEVRSQRVPPGRDEKRLASWNALAIRGLAIAGNVLEHPPLVTAAAEAADFVRDYLLRDGRLLASYKDGSARFPAYLDDHAFLLDALLELLQVDWQTDRLELAMDLADTLLARFFDADNGGFYFTADDHESLIHRPKPLSDESMPAGNGIAARALQRLGFLLGEVRYLAAAEATLRYAAATMSEFPHAHVTLLTALEEYLEHPEIVIIRGDPIEIASWRAALAKQYAPRRLVLAIPAATIVAGITTLVVSLRTGSIDAVIDPVTRTAQVQDRELAADQQAVALGLAIGLAIGLDPVQAQRHR